MNVGNEGSLTREPEAREYVLLGSSRKRTCTAGRDSSKKKRAQRPAKRGASQRAYEVEKNEAAEAARPPRPQRSTPVASCVEYVQVYIQRTTHLTRQKGWRPARRASAFGAERGTCWSVKKGCAAAPHPYEWLRPD